jgi:hypothetical protein
LKGHCFNDLNNSLKNKIMRKLVFLSVLAMLFTACENDDDITVIDESPTNTTYTLSNFGDIVYDGSAKIPVAATATPATSNTLAVRFIQVGVEVNNVYSVLTLNNGIYTINDNNFGITPNNVSDGLLSIELYTRQSSQTGWVGTGLSIDVTIAWPDDMDPIDDQEYAEVKFTAAERINVSGDDPRFKFPYTGNSFINGIITIELWKGGVDQDIIFDRTLIVQGSDNEPGEIETGNVPNLIPGETYQWKIINKNGQVPIFRFLDMNDDLSESYVINFVAQDSEISTAASSNIVFSNTTPTSVDSRLDIIVNSNNPETIYLRLYDAVGPGGNFVPGTQQFMETSPENSMEIFLGTYSGLLENTNYDFRYFLNDETENFFSGTHTTSSTGTYDLEIESTEVAINTASCVVEYDNTTGDDIIGTIQLIGINPEGNTHIESQDVVFYNGNVDTDIPFSKDGFKQNSSVLIEVIVNGEVEASTIVQTIVNTYSSYSFTNSTNNSIVLVSGQNNTVVGITRFVSEGFALIPRVVHLRYRFGKGLNLNLYNDNVRIGNSQTVDVSWIETSPGIWETDFLYSINIEPGLNSFEVALGNETYTPSGGAGTSDVGVLTTSFTDDNNIVIGESASGITTEYK